MQIYSPRSQHLSVINNAFRLTDKGWKLTYAADRTLSW